MMLFLKYWQSSVKSIGCHRMKSGNLLYGLCESEVQQPGAICWFRKTVGATAMVQAIKYKKKGDPWHFLLHWLFRNAGFLWPASRMRKIENARNLFNALPKPDENGWLTTAKSSLAPCFPVASTNPVATMGLTGCAKCWEQRTGGAKPGRRGPAGRWSASMAALPFFEDPQVH